jgi:hypothetical protein
MNLVFLLTMASLLSEATTSWATVYMRINLAGPNGEAMNLQMFSGSPSPALWLSEQEIKCAGIFD